MYEYYVILVVLVLRQQDLRPPRPTTIANHFDETNRPTKQFKQSEQERQTDRERDRQR